jgi:predicted DNA-binding transcriptional regulator YafY
VVTAESLWTERPLLLQRADGSYDLIGTTAHLDRLARWVLSHGPAARVQAPDRLRRRVAAEARRVLQKYGST